MPLFTNAQKRAAVKRELNWRRYVYPKRIADGKMKQEAADEQIAIFVEMEVDYAALDAADQAAAEAEAAKERLL